MEQREAVDVERLLQTIDIKRLKAIGQRHGQLHSGLNILRNEIRSSGRESAAQFLALSVVYLLSWLMSSRLRDILEPPTSPSPFFDTHNQSRRSSAAGSTNKRK